MNSFGDKLHCIFDANYWKGGNGFGEEGQFNGVKMNCIYYKFVKLEVNYLLFYSFLPRGLFSIDGSPYMNEHASVHNSRF